MMDRGAPYGRVSVRSFVVAVLLLALAPLAHAADAALAAYDGSPPTRAALLDAVAAGLDPLARDQRGVSIPMLAAEHGDAELLRMYVDAGLDLERHVLMIDGERHTAFSWGVRSGGADSALIAAMVALGVDPRLEVTGRAALHHATLRGDAALVRSLLDLGVSPHGVVSKDQPLQHAARLQHYEVAALLIDAGGDLFSLDAEGLSSCLDCQVGIGRGSQLRPVFVMALRMVSSLRMQAVRATLAGLPL